MNRHVLVRGVLLASAAMLLLAGVPAGAQSCHQYDGVLVDWSHYPDAVPTTKRAMAVEQLTWLGHRYLLLNNGDGLRLYDIADQLNPVFVADREYVCSYCPAHEPGDYDWVQFNFSVCDGCRWGVSHFWQAGLALLDLGTGQVPSLTAGVHYYEAPSDAQGAMTFKHNGQQYLIVNDLYEANPDDFPTSSLGCDGQGTATLFRMDGITPSDLTEISCIDPGISIMNGLYLSSGGSSYLYLIDRTSFAVHLFKVTGSGDNLSLAYHGAPFYSYSKFGKGLRADLAHDLLVTAINGTPSARLWDISDLGQPMELATFDPLLGLDRNGQQIKAARAAIRFPLVVLGKYTGRETYTFNIFNPTDPQPIDPEFWDTTNSWNSNAVYPFLANTDCELSYDGRALYLSRYSVAQVFDVSGCGPDLPPRAKLSLSPSPAFPGEVVTISDTTVGVVEASAMWVTDVGGSIVAGSDLLSAITPSSLVFTVPRALAGAQSYTASVAVENAQNPYNPQVPGDQLYFTGIQVDRAPQAAIAISPATAITGDTITLSAAASEGLPHDPTGANPYRWTITPPTVGNAWETTGVQTTVAINESGTWSFALTVQYEHYTQQGLLYSSSVSEQRSFSSIAADFTASGGGSSANRLCLEDPILLDASASQAAAGADLRYQWTVDGSNPGCSATSPQCTLPADSLTAGMHQVTLTLRNQANNDVSIKSRSLEVLKCAFTPVINVSTTTPDIGDIVMFIITGVPGSIDKAYWDFGGSGCDTGRSVTCTPGILDCRSQTFKYKTAGTKQVTLTVETDGVSYTANPVTVQVQSTGSCGAAPCTYNISPSSRSFPATGGNGAVTVSPSAATCLWSASAPAGWISITSGTAGIGGGTVHYSVAANSGSQRNGTVVIESRQHQVSQEAPTQTQADFTISNSSPEIGETVVLQTTSGTPKRWELGGASCDGDSTVSECSGSVCLTRLWRYRTAGTKTITMVCDEGSATKTITVQGTGSCGDECQRDAAPDPSFQISPATVETGQSVSFRSLAGTTKQARPVQVLSGKAGGLAWSPQSPAIGQLVSLWLTNVSTVTEATWSFGEPGCDSYEQTSHCVEDGIGVPSCDKKLFRFSSSGSKTITVTYSTGGSPQLVSQTLTVGSTGTCPGGDCTSSLDHSVTSFSAAGGSGDVTVNIGDGCTWTATSESSWITIVAGAQGSGGGTVSYQVAANSGASRSGSLQIAGRTYSVFQEAGGGSGGGDEPEWWQWQIRKGGQLLLARSTATFSTTFNEAGTYTVELTVGNCMGQTSSTKTLVVTETPVEPPPVDPTTDLVVPAVAHLPGAYNTMWVSDLKLFNADSEQLRLDLQFLPDPSVDQVVLGLKLTLDPFETAVFPDVLAQTFGQSGNEVKGGLLVTLEQGNMMPAIMSRTFNDTPTGTYGQYVPAVPMAPRKSNVLYIPGLKHNADFRTNLGVANGSDAYAGLTVTVLDEWGQQLGHPLNLSVRKHTTVQLSGIAARCGVNTALDLFTVRLEMSGKEAVVYASVVDNLSGDSIVQLPAELEATEVIIPGVAHNPGLHGSTWRSDVTVFNPTSSALTFLLAYVPETDIGYDPYFEITLPPRGAWGDTDLLSSLLVLGVPDGGTKGYLRISGGGDGLAPQVVARTYNQTVSDGTFGQAIPAYDPTMFVYEGERGFLPGLSNASYGGDRFRSNLGLVNLDPDNPAVVDLILYNKQGGTAGTKSLQLTANQYRQLNLFTELGLGDQLIEGSAIVQVQVGGPVIAFTSVVTDRTGDPFFMPLQVDLTTAD